MDHLRPNQYTGYSSRSFSSGSNDSSASSSSYSVQNANTPSTSPTLSDPGKLISNSDQASWSPVPGQSSKPGLSPLELLVQRGQQVQQDILRPSINQATSGNSAIYERATALSRKTSVRKPPIQPSPDPDDFTDDDARSIRSINLQSDAGSRFMRAQRSPSQDQHIDSYDGGPQRFDQPQQSGSDWQRRSSPLISHAFRSSIASDISFNSITDAAERMSIAGDHDYRAELSRRASVDTVRSSEFGDDGRWGRAWNSRADDEESTYEESNFGGDGMEDEEILNGTGLGLRKKSVDLDSSMRSGGLDSIASQWRSHQQQQQQQHTQVRSYSRQSDAPIPRIQNVANQQKVVNLTRTVPNRQHLNPATSYQPAEHRQSHVPEIATEDYDSRLSYYGTADRTPLSLANRQLGHRHTDSSSTINGNSSRSVNDSPEGARVYVYPPSPSSSEASRSSGSRNLHDPSHQSRSTQHYKSMPQASSAQVETSSDTAYVELESKRQVRGPVSPSEILSHPRGSPVIGPNARKARVSGHPAGRVPPPPPPPGGYSDPNEYFQGVDRPILGRTRQEAIARADGRESIVSDLDVETLRLSASSRRGSSSTIGTTMTSRMSIGSVDYDHIEIPDGSSSVSHVAASPSTSTSPNMTTQWTNRSVDSAYPRRAVSSPLTGTSPDPENAYVPPRSNMHPNETSLRPPVSRSNPTSPHSMQQPFDSTHMQLKASQASSRSLQPVQPIDQSSHNDASQNQSTPLRNTKSSNSLAGPRNISSTVMKPNPSSASEPAPTSTLSKPGASPAIDTRTGPSSAEDFLSQGITYHEQGDLARSAFYFERSAKVDGGCVVGMCMFGMALREGWGARKDPVKGFTWIQKAAAKAGEMMSASSTPKTDSELKAIRSELKLSVYELGKCFCYGWGVKMDKHMALEYFELAAKLGDPDAQAEAGALYAAGKGCKKDLKKAAMYYRMAEEGGYDTVGLSWIHKDKYK